ncbi:Endonuclease/exonuclease/phosphatase [Trametes meyenii]|nr:Endonuclease/exonuclease/phosphatase [Trametes meyenii]
MSLSQPRRPTVDLSSPPPGSTFGSSQNRTELSVTINPGQDSPFAPLTLQTNDIPGLRKVLDQCKRLRESFAAETDEDYDFEPFGWVGPYIAENALPPLLSPIPPDLRKIRKPIHARLSPASAGQSGNDVSDIEVLREGWMRTKVEQDLFARSEKASLKIRVGTFNVNGKLPSQDLSAWVRGQLQQSPASNFIPPLKEISPLSIGDANRNPIEDGMETLDLNSPSENSGSLASDIASVATASESATSTMVPVDTQSTKTAAADTPSDVSEDLDDPDMLVLGFQELDLSTQALLYSTQTTREDAWCMAVFAGLGEKAVLYEKLVSKQLVGMLLVIITKRRLRACFSEIRTSSVGAGIMGIMGNKGATAARLLFTPTPLAASADDYQGKPVSLTFVNAHLAAFDEMFERRNADFHDLSKRLQFDSGIVADDSGAASGNGYGPVTIQLGIYETDALFWLGDLNYRLTLPDGDVRTLLQAEQAKEENLTVLRTSDQLAFAMRSKKAFDGFVEALITHSPSYRFGVGLLTDSLGYDTKRKPAWTDRILHMASPGVTAKQTTYTIHPTITMSDHRPVSADFEVEIPVVAVTEYETFVERIWRDVSSAEYVDERPRLRVEPTSIDFSKVPCAFRFVAQTSAADVCPGWLRIEPMTGLVLPGEQAEVSLRVYVDDTSAPQLNVGMTRLEETLVLHTALGRDHFVAIAAEYGITQSPSKLA